MNTRAQVEGRARISLWRLRVALTVIRALLYLLVGIAALGLLWNIATYMLERPFSDFEAYLERADSFSVWMNTEGCDETKDSLDREHVRFHTPEGLENVWYSVQSESHPVSATIALRNGLVDVRGKSQAAGQIISDTQELKEQTSFGLTAKIVTIDFGNTESMILAHDVCAAWARLDPDYAAIDFIGISEKASIQTTVDFMHAGKTITVSVRNAEYKGQHFDELSLSFTSIEDYYKSNATFLLYGQDMRIIGPSGPTIKPEKPYLPLAEAMASSLGVDNPAGSIDLEYDGVVQLEISPSGRERRLYLGYHGDPFSDRRRMIWLHRASLFRQGDSGYTIGGFVSNAQFDETPLIRNRWEKAPPELQAALITATLAVLGWLAQKLLVKVNGVIAKLDTEESAKTGKASDGESSHLAKVPPGYSVLVLSSGYAIAGEVVKSPRWWSRRYILRNAFTQDHDGQWRTERLSEVTVEADKVLYSYGMRNSTDNSRNLMSAS